MGRMLAEQSVSDWVRVIRLSYRDSPEREIDHAHQRIFPRHCQQFVRGLRDRGHHVRYFAVGEYGGLGGRAHFHVVLFGSGVDAAPRWPLYADCHIEEWDHGFVYVQIPDSPAALAYVAKYVQKAESLEQKWVSLSKKPPLGAAFFREKARFLASMGAWPTTFRYRAPGAEPGKAYLMSGATRRDFMLSLFEFHGVDPSDAMAGRNPLVQDWMRRVDVFSRKQAERDGYRFEPNAAWDKFMSDYGDYVRRNRVSMFEGKMSADRVDAAARSDWPKSRADLLLEKFAERRYALETEFLEDMGSSDE